MEKATKLSLPTDFWNTTLGILRNGRSSAKTDIQIAAPTRLQIALWVVLMAAALIFFVVKYDGFQIGAHFQDDATYIVLAQSLIHSNVYGLINEAGAVLPTHYPIGFPLLLAPFAFLFPDNLDAFRLVSLFATLANISLLFWGWRYLGGQRSYWWGLVVTALYALAPLTVDFSRMVMSEPVFLTFCLIAFILAEQAGDHREGRLWSLWMGAVLLFAVLVRTVGVALVMSVFAYLLWKRGYRIWTLLAQVVVWMVVLAGVIVLFTPVSVWDLIPFGYVSQVAETASSDATLIQTLNPFEKITWLVGYLLRQLLVPVGGGQSEQKLFEAFGITQQPFLVGLTLLGMMVVGGIAWIRRAGLSSFNLFPPVYLAMIYFWHWEGIRFLYPIAPQLQIFFLFAIEAVLLWLARQRLPILSSRLVPRALFIAACALLVLAAVYKSIRLEPSQVHVGDMYARTAWVKTNTLPTDIIMTEEPVVDYVNSGRKTAEFRDAYTSASELAQDLQREHVQYVLLAPGLWWQANYVPQHSERMRTLRPAVEALVATHQLEPVYSNPEMLIEVFKVN